MALHIFNNETVGVGSSRMADYIANKLTDLGWECTVDTDTKTINIVKFGSIENLSIPYISGSGSVYAKSYPYYDTIICDTPGKELILILDNMLSASSSSSITLGTGSTNVYVTFYLVRDINGDVVAMTYSGTLLEGLTTSLFPLPSGLISQATSDQVLRLTQCLTLNRIGMVQAVVTPTSNQALLDISNLYLFTANHSLSQNTIYTDDAGVEYIGIHELFALRKDIYE